MNAHHEYKHKNKSIKGFGTYGDIMIRDRKMYVARTPFSLTKGTKREITWILPIDFKVDDRVKNVGHLVRNESESLVVGYSFDLISNEIIPQFTPNPNAGKTHEFLAYRSKESKGPLVQMT